MATIYQTAAYIVSEYKKIFGNDDIDTLKLNKLLYFARREGYLKNYGKFFDGSFYAGPYGPVVLKLKRKLANNELTEMPDHEWSDKYGPLIERIIKEYGSKSSISLSTLSHGEISWRNARNKQVSDTPYISLSEDDIMLDARKIAYRMQQIDRQCAN